MLYLLAQYVFDHRIQFPFSTKYPPSLAKHAVFVGMVFFYTRHVTCVLFVIRNKKDVAVVQLVEPLLNGA